MGIDLESKQQFADECWGTLLSRINCLGLVNWGIYQLKYNYFPC